VKKIKKITIKLATVNSAFFSSGGSNMIAAEITRILSDLVEKIDHGRLPPLNGEMFLQDYNGNTIGSVKVR